jgi:hypothetical protein
MIEMDLLTLEAALNQNNISLLNANTNLLLLNQAPQPPSSQTSTFLPNQQQQQSHLQHHHHNLLGNNHGGADPNQNLPLLYGMNFFDHPSYLHPNPFQQQHNLNQQHHQNANDQNLVDENSASRYMDSCGEETGVQNNLSAEQEPMLGVCTSGGAETSHYASSGIIKPVDESKKMGGEKGTEEENRKLI